jgi:hypothetical protein
VEAKASESDFMQAVEELQSRMADWPPAYHGPGEYMLCCAIAGTRLGFYAVIRGGKRCKPISRAFDMVNLLDRLEVKDDFALHMTVDEGVENTS